MENCPNGSLAKVAKFHANTYNFVACLAAQSTNSLFWVIFEELTFCYFPPPNTSIRGIDSNLVDLSLNILVFQTNGKQPYPFPVLSRLCDGLLARLITQLTAD